MGARTKATPRSEKPKPVCREGATWLIGRLGRGALAPLTGQDASALAAFLHLLELYARGDTQGRVSAKVAMRATVLAMQASTRHLAKAAIPHVLDWSDEHELWTGLFPSCPAAATGAVL